MKAVTFVTDSKGTEATVDDEGYYIIPNGKVNTLRVKYDADNGQIEVKSIANEKGKAGSVKVWLNFNGKIVKKSLSVGVDGKN